MTTSSMRKMVTAAALFAAVAGSLALAAAPRVQGPEQKEFTVVAERFKFTPDRLVVTQGDKVHIVIKSADGTHGFEIKKLKLETMVPKGGQPTTLDFVASEAGTFTITCSEYCGKGHSHMRAVLEVLPGVGQGGTR